MRRAGRPDAPRRTQRFAWPAALALLLACGGPDTASQLVEANERVQQVEAEVATARRAVEAEEADLEVARGELAAARERLLEAEERLAAARGRVAEVADDAYLFRQVQSALLGDPELEGLAISARVKDRVVTLEGHASTLRQHERAEALATATLGVERVENRIVVGAEPPGS